MLWILILVQVLEEIYHSFLKNIGHWTFESWMIWASLMNVPVTVILLTPQAHLATQRDCDNIKNSCSQYASRFPVSGSRDLSMPPLPHHFTETLQTGTH